MLAALATFGIARCAEDPAPKPAVQYVVDAFDRYPLVALSEWHESRDTMNFVRDLIRHPEFAGKVRDIVVEFGSARYQGVMDRYIAGEEVRREDLKQAWENTTQISGVWSSPIYEEFFANVREFNRTALPGKRIRVLLGDPPIDWQRVQGPADEDMSDWRDAHFAHVVEREVMKRGRRALLFTGGAHISRKVLLPNSLIHLLDRSLPGKTLVVSALQVPFMRAGLASRLQGWPTPSAAAIRGTWLGSADVRDAGFGLSKGRLEEDIDVVLFLGAHEFAKVPPRIDSEPAFAAELKRRQELHESTIPFRGGKIRFEHGTTGFAAGAHNALGVVLAELRRDQGLALVVKGHADGTEADADALSRRRAAAVADWLAQRGVERRRLEVLGCGASRPVWESDTEEHRAANRRAELVRKSRLAGCQPPASFE